MLMSTRVCIASKTFVFGLTSFTVLLNLAIAKAITVQDVPNPRQVNGGWISDGAEILSSQTEIEINRQIERLEQKNGTEIAVVTIPSTPPDIFPRTFAIKLFNYWGIGKATADNGVLLFVSVEDRRIEIITGRGIENKLSPRQVRKIIDQEITPAYKNQDFDQGTLLGVDAMIAVLASPKRFWRFLVFSSLGIIAFRRLLYRYLAERNRMLLEPGQNLKLYKSDRYRKVYCAQCAQPMIKMTTSELTNAQQIAKKIGSTIYGAYECPNCQPEIECLITYESPRDGKFKTCRECEAQTITTSKKVTKKATTKTKGKITHYQQCHCCGVQKEYQRKIPRIKTSRSSSSNLDHSSYYGDYSSSSGGYDSGGSDFGGGSCDDDGAGGDF